MTAEEFYKQKNWDGIHFDKLPNDVKIMMIAFAQYHTEEALKAAADKDLSFKSKTLQRSMILNAYPKELIK